MRSSHVFFVGLVRCSCFKAVPSRVDANAPSVVVGWELELGGCWIVVLEGCMGSCILSVVDVILCSPACY